MIEGSGSVGNNSSSHPMYVCVFVSDSVSVLKIPYRDVQCVCVCLKELFN